MASRKSRCCVLKRLAAALRSTASAGLVMVVTAIAGVAVPSAIAADGQVRGVVRAVQQASISTELAVRVARIGAREGEAFEAGEVLIEFDCRKLRATIAAGQAQEQEMQVTVDKNKLLLRTQSVGKSELEIAEARLAKAKAEVQALASQLDQCTLIAPFRGRVLELSLQVHETSQPNRPFMALVARDHLEIDLIVPSNLVRGLTVGQRFDFEIDELKKTVPALVARLGAAVDPISQTIKVIAVLPETGSDILPGMTGTATAQQFLTPHTQR